MGGASEEAVSDVSKLEHHVIIQIKVLIYLMAKVNHLLFSQHYPLFLSYHLHLFMKNKTAITSSPSRFSAFLAFLLFYLNVQLNFIRVCF